MSRIGTGLAIGILTLGLGVAQPAGAIGFEDSLDDCSYPRVFDVLVLRPLSITAMFVGAAIYVPIFPIAKVTVQDETSQIYDSLVGSPMRFAFERPLGECEGVQVAY